MIRHNGKKIEFWFLTVSAFVLCVVLFLFPDYVPFGKGDDNMFTVSLNGEEVGVTASEEEARECFRMARREIAQTSDIPLFIDANLEITGEHVNWGKTDSERDIVDQMKIILSKHELLTLQHCYSVKIGEYIFNMASADDIKSLLNEVLEQYDPERDYIVHVRTDTEREVNALTYEVLTTSEQAKQEEKQNQLPAAGIEQAFSRLFEDVKPAVGKDFEDYILGLQKIDFGEKIEISETYLPSNLVASLDEAKADVTGEVAKDAVCEVAAGDTLSGIASRYGLTTQELIAVNNLSGEDAVIRPGDVLSVKVAEPKLTVLYSGSKTPTPEVIAIVEENRKNQPEVFAELDALVGNVVQRAFAAATADEVYRIGAEDDWYPFTALREGKVQGMSADLVRAAFAASNTRVELVPYPYSRCMELTRTGRLAAQ